MSIVEALNDHEIDIKLAVESEKRLVFIDKVTT